MNALQTILLADDDPNDVFLMQRAFKKAKISTRLQVVSNGEQVVSYLAGEPPFDDRILFPFPALVLLDLKMPRKGGLEVLAWIRSQGDSLKRLPVVILTSSKQVVDVNRAYELGANSYLVKPVTFDRLMDSVRTLEFYWLSLCQRPEYANLSSARVSENNSGR